MGKKRPIAYRIEDEDEEEDLSFVVDDDEGSNEELNREMEEIQKRFRRNPHANYDLSDSSDMEANYSDIEYEERRTAKIGAKEDREELKKIQREEEEEERRRRHKKKMKKRQRREDSF